MKKLTSFILGLLIVLPLSANNFEKNETTGMYDFIGTDSVESISVDFTTWQASDLYDEAIGNNYASTTPHTLSFTEKEGLGFQRWVIFPNRWFATGVTRNALFNNSYPRDADSLATPAIYFPPFKWGIKQLSVFGKQGGRPLLVLGYRESTAAWEKLGTIAISGDNGINESTFDINSADICRIALYGDKANTAYTSITKIEITGMDEPEEPEDPLYVYNSTTERYDYVGEPVSAINIDFSTWATSDLPATLSDDMVLTEKDGLGFIKWKIVSRSCGEKGTVKALFNNNNSDFSSGPANNETTNPPRIYLPTTTRGVKNIKVFGGFSGSSGSVSVGVRYKDASHTAWTWGGSLVLPYSYAEVSLENDLNTTGQTSIYLEYTTTPYPAITNLWVELKDSPTGIDNANADVKVTKQIENGQLVIIKNGVRYNILGSNF